jgi:hypothetical protein
MAPALLVTVLALVVAGAVAWGARAIAGEIRAAREESARVRALQLQELFAPAISAAQTDPRALLAWQPMIRTARTIFPDVSAELDRASGGTFPFPDAQVQAAHAQWTADWLAWERTHDGEFKRKAAEAEHELAASGGSPLMRARLDAVESEKLDLYQRRYAEYVRVAKALQALMARP